MDLSIVSSDRRFLGVRIGLVGFLLAAMGYLVAILGYATLGICIFVVAWMIALSGLLIHIARQKNSPIRGIDASGGEK